MNSLALTIIGETTGRAYARILKSFNTFFSSKLPSEYFLNKLLPIEVEPVSYAVTQQSPESFQESQDLIFGNSTTLKTEDEALVLLSSDDTTSKVVGAKLKGELIDYVNIILQKMTGQLDTISISNNNDNISAPSNVLNGEDLILISSFDGAQAMRSSKKIDSVVTFSSQLITSKLIENDSIKAGSSINILTWFQYLGKEDWKSMKFPLNSYLEQKKKCLLVN